MGNEGDNGALTVGDKRRPEKMRQDKREGQGEETICEERRKRKISGKNRRGEKRSEERK